ncbi:hypothetical protein WDZ92_40750, partial [Nostoc sp. NIES-2111]
MTVGMRGGSASPGCSRAAAATARKRIAEVAAWRVGAQPDTAAAEGQTQQARSALQQAQDDLDPKQELNRRNADVVTRRELERLQVAVDGRKGALDA